MNTAAKKIVVCGGNGFLGSRICKHAVARGWNVISLSRSGEPKWSTVSSSPTPPDWSKKVDWQSANVFSPESYAPLLKDADFVVHSMGILLEADYKSTVAGTVSPLTGLFRAFSSSKSSDQNPLARSEGEASHPHSNGVQLTYENMNRDSAVSLAGGARNAGATAFCYISAAGGAPVLPARYIESKRDAESLIATRFPTMRGIYLRPGLLYDESRWITMGVAAATGVSAAFNSVTGGVLGGFLGAAGVRPQRVERVAEAVVEALGDEAVSGPVEVGEMETLADRAWRRGML